MRHKFLIFVCAILTFAGCSTVDKTESVKHIQCTVLTFESGAGMKAGEAESVTGMFSTALQNSGRFAVMERKQLNLVIQEQQFQASQGEDSTVKSGKVLAIHKMFSGSIGMLGQKYVVNVKMIDVESSQVNFAISKTYDDDIEDIGKNFLPELVQEILQRIEKMQTK